MCMVYQVSPIVCNDHNENRWRLVHFTRMHCEQQKKMTEKDDIKPPNDMKFLHREEISLLPYACPLKEVHLLF